MNKIFRHGGDIGKRDLLDLYAVHFGAAHIGMNRPVYSLIDPAEMARFLSHTHIDRHIWRKATPDGDTTEMVCTSFSAMMFGLMEQERLRCEIIYPFTFARVLTLDHALNGFIGTDRRIYVVEPQTDKISDAVKYQSANPTHVIDEVQHV